MTTPVTITITIDADTARSVLDLLGTTVESQPPAVVESAPEPAPSPFALPAEPAASAQGLSTDSVIARLIAGDRSPEVLSYINDPSVSVPEQVAAQKTYPDPGLAQ